MARDRESMIVGGYIAAHDKFHRTHEERGGHQPGHTPKTPPQPPPGGGAGSQGSGEKGMTGGGSGTTRPGSEQVK
jgi:hypothetical protein